MKYLFTIVNFLLCTTTAFSQAPCEKPVITRQPKDSTACAGTKGFLNISIASATPATFVWKKAPSQTIGTTTSSNTGSSHIFPQLTMSDAGTYFVEVTNSCGTTISNNSIINISTNVAPAIAINGSQTIVCENASVQIKTSTSGGGNYPMYRFYMDGVDKAFGPSDIYTTPPLAAGPHEFRVELTSNSSCIAPEYQNPISIVTVLAEKMPSISNAGTDMVTCSNEYRLNAINPTSGTGKWTVKSGIANIVDPSNPISLVTGFQAGYTFEAEWTVSSLQKACPSNTSFVKITRVSDITSPGPVMAQSRTIKSTDPAPLLTGLIVTPTEVGQWTAVGPALITANGQTSNLIIGHNLFYYTIYSTIPACNPSTATVNITVEAPLGLELTDVDNEIKIYPNPFKNDLTIELLQNESTKVKIFDSSGALKAEKAIESQSKITLGNDYPAGVYSIIVSTKTKSSTYRVIKQ